MRRLDKLSDIYELGVDFLGKFMLAIVKMSVMNKNHLSLCVYSRNDDFPRDIEFMKISYIMARSLDK